MKKKGVTTGACAQAAAKACALMLSKQKKIDSVDVVLPVGTKKNFSLRGQYFDAKSSRCFVVKHSGDPHDVTDGIEIHCEIKTIKHPGIAISGGNGIGRVTKPGLAVPVGEYAINPIPREMITRDVTPLLPKNKGFHVTISAPRGKEIAAKTYNARLGIQDGISIIGTTGIVEAKSEEAYQKALSLELNIAKAAGHQTIYLVSGYIGEKLLKEKFNIPQDAIIKIGDHVGFMLKECAAKGIRNVVLAGHIGKLVKVAGGLFNTHSRHGDARLEIIAAHAASLGADRKLTRKLLRLDLAEQSVELLRQNKLTNVFDSVASKIVERSQKYCENKLTVHCLLLSLKGEILGRSPKNILIN